jgi:hypothetical protein
VRQAYSAAESRFRASKAAQSRRGESKMVLSPRSPPLFPMSRLLCGCGAGRLGLQRVSLNFRFQRKKPSANSPLHFLCGLYCSRCGLYCSRCGLGVCSSYVPLLAVAYGSQKALPLGELPRKRVRGFAHPQMRPRLQGHAMCSSAVLACSPAKYSRKNPRKSAFAPCIPAEAVI